MSKVCKDTETEPKLTPFSGKKLQGRMSNISSEVSVDIRARGLWIQGQQVFFKLLFSTLTPAIIETSPCSNAML